MTTLIMGWDASHYDDPPDAARMIREGFSFFTHKAGGDANDAELSATWQRVQPYRSRALLVGAYWVVRPDLHSDAVSDADAFLARLDSQCPGWRDGPFILQADCESWGDSSGRKKPNKAHIKAFCDRLKAKCPKLTPIVYASRGDYGDSLAGLPYPLWNARYSVSYKTGTASGLYAQALAAGSGWTEYSGQVPAIWQFTSSATIAGQTTCDANAYRGTLKQLTALVAPGWDIMATLDQDDITNVATATVTMLLNTKLPDPNGPVDPATGLHVKKAISSILAWRDFVDVAQADRVIGTLAPMVQGNVQALAQELAPLLNNVSASELQAAIVGALLQLANPQPPAQLHELDGQFTVTQE